MLTDSAWICRFFKIFIGLLAAALLVALPYSLWWLHASGDVAVDRAVQAQANGAFVLFGSGLSQDFIDYKLRLYEKVQPDIITIGSSRVMQFRGVWFSKPFLNMGGVAGNLGELNLTLNALLKIKRPQIAIIGVDFWWFLPQWQENPDDPVQHEWGTYNYGLNSLKKPYVWLLEGKISLKDFFAPLLGLAGRGFRADRYGIMAQQTNDGFGPDGSWYYTAEITGLKPPFDYKFADTLTQVERGIKAFYHARAEQNSPAMTHLEYFADICCRLKTRGVKVFVFIPPLSQKIFKAMREREKEYPHLFKLRQALLDKGIDVMDFSNPAGFASDDCEFVDGFHGGEVAYARLLRQMADHWPQLLAFVHMDRLDSVIREWRGHALVQDERLTTISETDFMDFGCKKKTLP